MIFIICKLNGNIYVIHYVILLLYISIINILFINMCVLVMVMMKIVSDDILIFYYPLFPLFIYCCSNSITRVFYFIIYSHQLFLFYLFVIIICIIIYIYCYSIYYYLFIYIYWYSIFGIGGDCYFILLLYIVIPPTLYCIVILFICIYLVFCYPLFWCHFYSGIVFCWWYIDDIVDTLVLLLFIYIYCYSIYLLFIIPIGIVFIIFYYFIIIIVM